MSVTVTRGWRITARARASRSASGAGPRDFSGLPGLTSHQTPCHGFLPVCLSHGWRVQDLSGRQEGIREHPPELPAGRQDRRRGRQRVGQIHPAARHGGLDKDFTGEAWAAKGATVGYLPQEPQLDPALDVRGNVMLGVAAKQAKLDRYNELAMNYSDETADEMALQDEIDAENLWDLDSQIDVAMEALRCPPDDANVTPCRAAKSGGCAVQAAAGGARHAAAGRTDQPPGCRNHRLAAKAPDRIQGHDPDRDPRPLFPRRHHRLDPGTRSRPGHSLRGQLFLVAGTEGQALAQEAREDRAKQKVLERELEWIRAGAKARQAKQKARINAYEEMASKSEREKITSAQIIIPNGPRLGGKVIEVEGLTKAYGDKLLIENLSFALPPGGIVGVIGPNGAGKSTLFRMLTGQEKPDAGTITFGDTVKLAYVDQSRDALDAGKTVWEEISDGLEVLELGDATMNSRAYCGAFNFKGGDQQKKVGPAVGR
jgi:ABC-type nitrate/sulfonate/bicarbonate transport system ATPase subunit